jgi:hypothetical protein
VRHKAARPRELSKKDIAAHSLFSFVPIFK